MKKLILIIFLAVFIQPSFAQLPSVSIKDNNLDWKGSKGKYTKLPVFKNTWSSDKKCLIENEDYFTVLFYGNEHVIDEEEFTDYVYENGRFHDAKPDFLFDRVDFNVENLNLSFLGWKHIKITVKDIEGKKSKEKKEKLNFLLENLPQVTSIQGVPVKCYYRAKKAQIGHILLFEIL